MVKSNPSRSFTVAVRKISIPALIGFKIDIEIADHLDSPPYRTVETRINERHVGNRQRLKRWRKFTQVEEIPSPLIYQLEESRAESIMQAIGYECQALEWH
jgi:hypothetical protein